MFNSNIAKLVLVIILLMPAHAEGGARERTTLKGHTNRVHFVSVSPDGRIVASAGGIEGYIKLWATDTGREVATLKGHTQLVRSLAYSPDGSMMASASSSQDDRVINLWDMETRQVRTKLEGHPYGITRVAFSPDGSTLASSSRDGTIRLWDVTTGQEKAVLPSKYSAVAKIVIQGKPQPMNVMCVSFSPDGKTLASGSGNWDNSKKGKQGHGIPVGPGVVTLWDVATWQIRATLKGHASYVECVAFSPDGRTLASASYDETVKLWDVKTGKEQATLRGHTEGIRSVAFSPNGRLLATGSHDKTVKLWDVATRQVCDTLSGHTHEVYSVAFSPDGKTLASASKDKTLKLWDIDY